MLLVPKLAGRMAIQRLHPLARISALDAVPRLLRMAASHTAQLYNLSELAAPFQFSRPTIGDYVTLLERIFLLERLPPWHSNHASRLVKTPKMHLGDTGLACGLLGLDAATLSADRARLGPLLETFVFQELRRQASWHTHDHAFFHFRDRDKVEVDIVIERDAHRLAGVEVKAAATVTPADSKGLRRLSDRAGRHFRGGVLLHAGTGTLPLETENCLVVPLARLWDM